MKILKCVDVVCQSTCWIVKVKKGLSHIFRVDGCFPSKLTGSVKFYHRIDNNHSPADTTGVGKLGVVLPSVLVVLSLPRVPVWDPSGSSCCTPGPMGFSVIRSSSVTSIFLGAGASEWAWLTWKYINIHWIVTNQLPVIDINQLYITTGY